jgi:hypothetical protein
MTAVPTLERQVLRNESAPRPHRGLALGLLLVTRAQLTLKRRSSTRRV